MAEAGGLGRTGIILISFIAILVIIVIALQAAHLHLYRTNNDVSTSNDGSPSFQLPLPDYLRQTFPGHFQTDTEIEHLARSTANRSSMGFNVTMAQDFTLQDGGQEPFIEMVEMHTCCCKINTRLIYPTTAVDVQGINRTLASFRGFRQMFYTEKCTHVGSDSSCRCSKLPILDSGVYIIDETRRKYGVTYFYVGNVCVGLNT